MSTPLFYTLTVIAISACILLYKLKPKYICYFFSYYNKKFFQNRKSISAPVKFISFLFIVTILYTVINYNPFSETLDKIKPFLPGSISDYLTKLQPHSNIIKITLLSIEFSAIILFLFLFIKTPPFPQKKITNELLITEITKYKNLTISSYFGSIHHVRNIQLIVTSENSDLDLASTSSTSISGRVRLMASTRDAIGRIINDPLYDNISNFKKSYGKNNDFKLGTCIPSQPFELDKRGVKCVMHAVSIKKNNDNTIYSDKDSIKEILLKSLNHCIDNSYNSIFIPIFGIGSAQQDYAKSIRSQLSSLKSVLDDDLTHPIISIHLYLGVYRELDDLFLKKTTMEIFR